jgi:hypothetical protein
MIPGDFAEHIFEVFCHPFTAGETVAQARLGVLRVNGEPARAHVVDRLGNGDYLVRIELAREVSQRLELVA